MSEIYEINAEQLDEHVAKGGLVLLLIWVKRCDQCDSFKPIFEELSDRYEDATFLMMNMYESMENMRLAEKYEKSITPIVPVFCKGEHIGTFVGDYTLEDFKAKLDEVIAKNC